MVDRAFLVIISAFPGTPKRRVGYITVPRTGNTVAPSGLQTAKIIVS